jgi:hypothetical protein
MDRKQIEDRLREIEDRLVELVPTQTRVQGQPTSMKFSDEAALEEHERLLGEKRELLRLLTGK